MVISTDSCRDSSIACSSLPTTSLRQLYSCAYLRMHTVHTVHDDNHMHDSIFWNNPINLHEYLKTAAYGINMYLVISHCSRELRKSTQLWNAAYELHYRHTLYTAQQCSTCRSNARATTLPAYSSCIKRFLGATFGDGQQLYCYMESSYHICMMTTIDVVLHVISYANTTSQEIFSIDTNGLYSTLHQSYLSRRCSNCSVKFIWKRP